MNYINLILYVMGLALIFIGFLTVSWGIWGITRDVAEYLPTQRNTHDQEAKQTLWVEKHVPAGLAGIERARLEAAFDEAVFLDKREIDPDDIHGCITGRLYHPTPNGEYITSPVDQKVNT